MSLRSETGAGGKERAKHPKVPVSETKGSGSQLLLKAAEVCRLLGNIHPRTLARMEKRGLISPVPLLRHKLYAFEDINNLVEGLRKWKA